MKLNWFSPLPPSPTGIAEYTATIVPWLSAHAAITLWTDQETWDPAIEKYAAVRQYTATNLPWDELNAGNAVYHIGNNPDFHRTIWEVSQRHAGVVILHDLRLQDFFWSIFKWEPDTYIALMQSTYGKPGADAAVCALKNPEEELQTVCLRFPLAEAAIKDALGVLVHTPGGFDLLSGKCHPPLGYLPFPYAAASESTLLAWEVRRNRPPKPPYQLVMMGYINPNRRLNSILQALARMPDRDRFRLDVFGPVWGDEDVKKTIADLGLETIVTLRGYTSPSDLDQAIAGADLALNLRFPTMGEASMSQLQVWDHRLPSMVTRTGWYGTLPENSVLFVEPEREIEDLTRHLTAFANNPGAFTRLGENGRKVLFDQHAPEQYASNLVDFLNSAVKYRPTAALIKASGRVGTLMQGWIRPLAAEHAGNRLAGILMEFLG